MTTCSAVDLANALLPSKQSVDGSNPSGGVKREAILGGRTDGHWRWSERAIRLLIETSWDGGDTHHAASSLLTDREFEVSPGESNPFQALLNVLLQCSSLLRSIHLDEVQIFLVLGHPGNEIRSAVGHGSRFKPARPTPLG